MFNKKGYFFIIDSLVAISILGIGLFIILSSFSSVPPQQQASVTSKDVMDFIVSTRMSQFITIDNFPDANPSNSIIEQILEYLYLGQDDFAGNLASEALGQIVPVQFNIWLVIDDSPLYIREFGNIISDIEESGIDETNLLIPTKTYVITVYDQSVIIGPYLVEVYIWQ